MNPVSRWQRFKRWWFGWCEKHQCYEGNDDLSVSGRICPECQEEWTRKAIAESRQRKANEAERARAARIQEIREGVLLALQDFGRNP